MGGFAYELERKAITKTDLPVFEVGDSVDVHVRIVEGQKERVQIFSGVVIARQHQGLRESFTVRRIVSGEGVEQVFPIHSPKVAKIEVTRRGNVRRAKLYYLRDRVGKRTRIEEDLKRSRETVVDKRRTAMIDKEALERERAEAEAAAKAETEAAAAAEAPAEAAPEAPAEEAAAAKE